MQIGDCIRFPPVSTSTHKLYKKAGHIFCDYKTTHVRCSISRRSQGLRFSLLVRPRSTNNKDKNIIGIKYTERSNIQFMFFFFPKSYLYQGLKLESGAIKKQESTDNAQY